MITNWGDSRGGNYWCPPFPQMGPQYLTNPFPANYKTMRPPPANQQTTIVDIQHPQDEDDEWGDSDSVQRETKIGRHLPLVKVIHAESNKIKAVPPKTSETDIEKIPDLDVLEKEKRERDLALINQLSTLTPLYPVVNKIKVKNKKKSVVPVVPEVTESEKSDTENIKSDDTDNPLFIEGIVRSLLPYIYMYYMFYSFPFK